MRTAIMGVGSLGTILGAFMWRAGIESELIDTNAAHIEALNNYGARVTGEAEFTVPVKAVRTDEMTGIYDVVILMVKQTYNDGALRQLLPHLGPKSTVCTLQNGIPEYAVSKIIGGQRVVGGVVGWGASFIGPGVSQLTTAENGWEFDIGEIDGSITDRIKCIQELLQSMCKTNILTNLMGVRWNKIIANAAMSGMSAALGCTFGDILDNEEALLRAKFIANECIHVCEASGVRMAVRHGYDHGNLLRFETREEMEAKDWLFKKIWYPHKNLKASMLQDLEKGRVCEIDYIDGVVCDIGREYGVSTPVCDQVVKVVKDIECGKLKPQMSNVKYIALPDIV